MTLTSFLYMKKNHTRKYPENRLPHFMKLKTLEKEDVAERLKVDKESVRRWIVGESDLTHGKMISLADLFGCKPYELIVDKEDILKEELAYLNEQRRFFNAYKSLSSKDKRTVDNVMFSDAEDPKKISPENGVSGSRKGSARG